MTYEMTEQGAMHIAELYAVLLKTLKLERNKRRRLVRTLNKFYLPGKFILKAKEVSFTIDLITANLSAIDTTLKEKLITTDQRAELEKRVISLKQNLILLKRGKPNANK